MNTQIQKMTAEISALDMYSQLSVYGAWAYIVNSQSIKGAMRFIPDQGGNGIEHFTPYEQARLSLIREAEVSTLPALLQLREEISGLIGDAGGEARSLENTLEFMMGRQPSRDAAKREYEDRRRQGCTPRMTIQAFVAAEYAAAQRAYEDLLAKGQDAIRLCETLTFDRDFEALPDWVPEAFENKLIEKLLARIDKLELTRSNPRRPKAQRDAAELDQKLIYQVLSEYGISEPEAPAQDPDVPFDDSLEELDKSLAFQRPKEETKKEIDQINKIIELLRTK